MHAQVQEVINLARSSLDFDILGQSRALLRYIQHTQNDRERLAIQGLLVEPPVSTITNALNAISLLLGTSELTLVVADLFRPLLIDLCARMIDNSRLNDMERLSALCLLVEPYEEVFPVLAAYLDREEIQGGPLVSVTRNGRSLTEIPAIHLQRILLAYYRLLAGDPETPTRLGWSPHLLQSIYCPASGNCFGPHPDRTVRWLALRCFAHQTHLPEATREKLEVESIGEYAVDPLPLCISWELHVDQATGSTTTKDVVIDAWFLPIVELKRIQTKREELATQPNSEYFRASHLRVSEIDLHPHIVHVAGILLFTRATTSIRNHSTGYVPTPTATNTLRALALHVSQRIPTLLTATPASGKLTLLRELARRVHPESEHGLVVVQLADTALDAKSLIGSYVSTAGSDNSTGGFIWQDGVLPRALRAGKWLVLADVDRASTEVLATLLPVIEGLQPGKHIGELASLDLGGGRGSVQGSPDFMIFGMRSVTKTLEGKPNTYPSPTFFGHKHWFEIELIPPTADELVTIVERRFPQFTSEVSRAAVGFWQEMEAAAKTLAKPRDMGMRDLEKFCTRLERSLPSASPGTSFAHLFPNHVVREEILLEARDIFFAAYDASSPHFILLSTRAAQILELDVERRDSVLAKRTPEYVVRKSGKIDIGRSQLFPRSSSLSPSVIGSKTFALHRPALTILETIAVSVSTRESILLVGETGTGKTTLVQHMAGLTQTPLVVLNMSNQSETSDLLGGFRPVDARVPAARLQETFMELFGAAFSRKKNKAFEDAVRAAYVSGKWPRVVKLWKEAGKLASKEGPRGSVDDTNNDEGPRKRRKVRMEWDAFMLGVDEFDAAHVKGQSKFVFSFVEGPLVTALRNGNWVLLDEVNLASAETLECIASILQGPNGSVTLTEAGYLEPIPRHPDFRLFACMNPATDAGKKDLPPNIRSRFTEVYVPPPDADEEALRGMISQHIGYCALADKIAITNVADFYMAAKRLTATRQLADGQNHTPHFSMRTLTRALTFACDLTPMMGLRRALWEGITMAFMMTLDTKSAEALRAIAQKHILTNAKNLSALFNQPVPAPEKDKTKYIQMGPFWLLRGPEPVQSVDEYVLTPSVEAKLVDLARIVTTRRFPVLIQGPTSSGKTSSVEYLAKRTGHRFVRINNHEHTDLQEYLGSYLTDPATGKLKFQDGILVRALRAGDWIVLDELNLAPTDVLEALNRLLDDNRELVVPETNETIRPHPNFMLFATQNPPGLYAGRKVLSRAFRNRFLEVHFDDVPQDELEAILCQRCQIAQSHGRRIVAVFQELQKRRQVGRVFETKNSFATLRDLFRWANRHSKGYDESSLGGNYQHLAEQGFMLLAERTRRDDDRAVVKAVIEDIMKVKIDEKALYDVSRSPVPPPTESNIVWTGAMQRLFTLVATAVQFNEPVLLVGETGSGKTSVCELLAHATNKSLHSLSCHQNTETADLLGSQRPLRNRTALRDSATADATELLRRINYMPLDADVSSLANTVQLVESALKTSAPENTSSLQHVLSALRRAMALFEWHDGPLIQAMRSDGLFLLDEISLADDSVLERLNSVLEPSRTVVLAEKGGDDISNLTVQASSGFQLVATMNPGGDYGKKELSPALRNRFTEIWVPHISTREDLEQIIHHSWTDERLHGYTSKLLDFVEYTGQNLKDPNALGLRGLLTWVQFTNSCTSTSSISPDLIFHHAAHLTALDGLASFASVASLPSYMIRRIEQTLKQKLDEFIVLPSDGRIAIEKIEVNLTSSTLSVGSFSIELGAVPPVTGRFSLEAPTSRLNAARIVRALQIQKPLLLEGSPGVGKTSLVVALAGLSGHALSRINLSDQTDLIDLFGSDMPIEGGNPGEFAWRSAAFLRAMENGDWVLLDEMNLAPQAVLEGLNAVLDHRGTIFIPELNREFTKHPDFRVFAAQNPLGQGGGRKGLPKSFVNRFTKVYIESLSRKDLQIICRLAEPDISESVLEEMLTFNERLCEEVVAHARFGREGNPWEFNLRDVLRWMTLCKSAGLPRSLSPIEYVGEVYISRFRTLHDRSCARALYDSTKSPPVDSLKPIAIGLNHVQFGHTVINRTLFHAPAPSLAFLRSRSGDLEVVSKCIDSGSLLILNGPSYSGKTSLLRTLASIRGTELRELCLNPGTDASDLLGGFEHSNWEIKFVQLVSRIRTFFGPALPADADLGNTLDALVKLQVNSIKRQLDSCSLLLRRMSAYLETLPDSNIPRLASDINQFLNERSSAGRFEWVDGPLVQAMKDGVWLVLDHCNLCTPAVLDRLNSLCETGGALVLNERGNVGGEIPIVNPHPHFRLIMLLDPRYGELSRAMRNRGIEVSISDIDDPHDTSQIRLCARLPKIQTTKKQLTTEDVAVAQLHRRGLALLGAVELRPTSSVVYGTLDLAVNNYRLFGSIPLLGLLDKISGVDSTGLLSSLPRQLQTLGYSLPHDLWTRLSSHKLIDYCNGLRLRIANFRGVPSQFLSSQPVLLHMNPNLLSAESAPEQFPESVVLESAWEAITRVHVSPPLEPLANIATDGQLSLLDKSRLMWGGAGTEITAPRFVGSIAPLVASLQSACIHALACPDVFRKQHAIDSIHGLIDYTTVFTTIASSNFVDYAAIRLLVRSISDTFNDSGFPKAEFHAAALVTNDLLRDTAINSGQAMPKIWATMRLPSLGQESQAAISQLFASLVRGSRDQQDMHRKSIDVAAMLHVESSTEVVQCALKLAEVQKKLPVNNAPGPLDIDHEEFCVSTVNVAADALNGGISSQKLVSAFFDVASCVPRNEWSPVVYLKVLIWERESSAYPNSPTSSAIPSTQSTGGYSLQTFFGYHLGWMKSCWPTTDTEGRQSSPALFLTSVEHPACHKRCAASSVEISQYREYEEALRTQCVHLGQQAHSTNHDRIVSLCVVWIHSMSLIFAAFGSESTQEDQARILNIQSQLSHSSDRNLVLRAMIDLTDFLKGCSIPLLGRAVDKYLSRPLGSRLSEPVVNSELANILGMAWIGAAYMLLELYFPEVPMDPLGEQYCRHMIWGSRLDWLRTHIHTISLGQEFAHNVDFGSTLERLRNTQAIAEAQYAQTKPLVVRGSDHLQHLTELSTEVHSFLTQAVEYARISQLAGSFEGEVRTRDISQEQMIQGTISTFLRRVHQKYPDLVDIILPVEYALHQLKLGLRLRTSTVRWYSGNNGTISSITRCLLQKPTLSGCQALLEWDLGALVTTVPLSVSAVDWVLIKSNALLFLHGADHTPHFPVHRLTEFYDQLLQIWLSQKERDARAEEEGRSLYKPNKTSQEELENELEELFPSYASVLEDSDPAAAATATTPTTSFVSDANIRSVHHTHAAWAALVSNPPNDNSLDANYRRSAIEAASRITQNYEDQLDASIDQAGFGQRVQITKSSLSLLDLNADSSFDFYHGSNIAEVTKAARFLDNLCTRLDALIIEWPDQMILRHLKERSQAISKLRLDSPLAKVLSALEQLLLQTDDWETYANRENTLKPQQQQLISLIVDWRRLELRCWSTLLDRETSACVHSVSAWWPQLYESVVGVAASLDADTSKLESHLAQLIPLLDSYLTHSPLGQFEPRLVLLQSFARLSRQISLSPSPGHFSVVADMLETLSCGYLEMLPSVQSSLANQRKNIDKEINDFIKLASWKDTNVHALKQSAQKTHHVLHKCIRKFRSIIRQPVSEALTSQSSTEPSLDPETSILGGHRSVETIAAPVNCLVAVDASPLCNIDIKIALGNYRSHVAKSGQALVRNVGTEATRTLTSRIITGAKELSEATIPESEGRERHIKTLLSQKRRAWSDLLKELRRLGLATSVTTDALIQQENRATLLRIYLDVDKADELSVPILKSNRQFVRLLGAMPNMRAAFQQHHSDISARDFRRAANLVESSFSIVIETRKSLKASLSAYNQLRARLDRMNDIQSQLAKGDSIYSVGENFYPSFEHARSTVGRLCSVLKELLEDIANFGAVVKDSGISLAVKESVERKYSEGVDMLNTMTELEARALAFGTPIWTRDEVNVFSRARAYVSDVKATLGAILATPSTPPRLFQPAYAWIETVEIPEKVDPVTGGSTDLSLLADDIISRLLVNMQTIVTTTSGALDDSTSSNPPDKIIRTGAQHVHKVALALALEDIALQVQKLTGSMSRMSEDQVEYSIHRLTPFLQLYLGLVHDNLAETVTWLNEISRLTHVLASTVRTLMQKGFCKPPDAEEGSEGKQNGELAEGTGMGEGAGAENISNQIEDEAQVEGLRGEQESGSQEETHADDDKDAIEMSEDFAGATEDMEDGEDDNEDRSEAGSDPDPEERIEDLDSANPNVVDEKLWNNESASEKPEGHDQAGDDNAAQPGDQSETAAKEDKPQNSAKREADEDSVVKEDPPGSEAGSGLAEEQGMEEDHSRAEDDRRLDDFVPEANTLELPENLDLGPDDDAPDAGGSEDELGEDEDIEMIDDDLREGQNEGIDEEEPGVPLGLDHETASEVESDSTETPENTEGHAEASAGNQDADGENTQTAATEAEDRPGGQGTSARSGKNQGDTGDDTEMEEANTPNPDFGQDAQQSSDAVKGDAGARTRSQGGTRQQEPPSRDSELPNPLRSPGDASKEIQRRVDQILNRQDKSQSTGQLDRTEIPTEVEYCHDDDAEQDMQALGALDEANEAAKLRDLRISDVPAPVFEEEALDVDMELDPAPQAPGNDQPKEANVPRNLQGALTADDVHHSSANAFSQDVKPEQHDTGPTTAQDDEPPKPEPPINSDNLEAIVAEWQTQGHPVEGAEEIWRLYETLTQDLSHSLCEQLRLILTPTRATRLRGDFRTGKRLNMKKLVPYVASDFTRDKIWLRRTRPAAREYQVLLAIDDSRSMARAPHTIHLTRQALALVARALEKLEVGELALARFGREFEVVHDFGAGVVHGGAALARFTFDQPATDVLHLLESSLEALRDARERSRGQPDLWQLEIIISDGICQDHERLRTVLRRAEEDRVMVVFIVIDAPAQNGSDRNSIISMLQPTIRSVNGQMDIQMERYLDSFPFQYFVVLRDVDALPDVLAGTLRQFFERISED